MGAPKDKRRIALAMFAAIVGGVVAVVLISCGGDSSDSTTTAASAKGGCKKVEAPPPKKVDFDAPKQVLKKGEKATAVVETSCGTFDIALDTTRAPKNRQLLRLPLRRRLLRRSHLPPDRS
jgi:hypothetical protein